MKYAPLLSLATMVAVLVGYVTCQKKPPCETSLLTFNAALTPLVHGYEERRHIVPDALLSQAGSADVICLQEIWFEDDMHKILSKMENTFPFHYSPIHNKVGHLREEKKKKGILQSMREVFTKNKFTTVPCTLSKLLKAMTCFAMHCFKTDDQQKCMMVNCHQKVYNLSDTCRSCMSVASTGPTTVIKKCANGFSKFNRMNAPGLLVLSKRNLTNVNYAKYHANALIERGYIEAKVEGGPTIVCTHLSAKVDRFHEEGLKDKYSNYDEMQAAEISQLNRTFHATDHVLLGDLNTGPKTSKLQGEFPASYRMLSKGLRYKNPYLRNGTGTCTYCDDNPVMVAAGKEPYGDVAIDHVLLSRNFKATIRGTKRVLDKGFLSDHYGVQLNMKWCPKPWNSPSHTEDLQSCDSLIQHSRKQQSGC